MQVDYALILSAGLGTRMGEIGKNLPKVMWPIFSKTLLQLQIDLCKDLGINKIFINVHFLADEIISHISEIPQENFTITILREDPLLDSGGAIHNLAQRTDVDYKGNLLLLNGDQFHLFDQDIYNQALEVLKNSHVRATLFGIKVDKSEKYNETVIKDNVLIDIRKNSGVASYITYSGLGLVKLTGLTRVAGISKFFHTVANYNQEKVCFLTPEQFEYWDFGTAEVYAKNIFKILENKNTLNFPMINNFLRKHNVDVLHMGLFANEELKSIDLNSKGRFEKNTILANEIKQEI